jgi:hypothetical protein
VARHGNTSARKDFYRGRRRPGYRKKTHENKVDYSTFHCYDPELMKRKDFERDTINRQRNIVFPDTVLNEGRFYRNIFSRDAEFTRGQRIGLGLIGLFFIAMGTFGIAMSVSSIMRSKGGESAVSAYPIPFLAGMWGLGLIVLLRGVFPPEPNRLKRLQTARRPRRHPRP